MSPTTDAIPVLTDVVEDDLDAGAPTDRTQPRLDELEAHLALAIHARADALVHDACRDMEALLLERVADRLRSELPTLVARIIHAHLRGPAGSR